MTDREGIIRLATEYMGWPNLGKNLSDTSPIWNLWNPFESIAAAYELESAIPEAKRRAYSVILNRIVTDQTPHELDSWGTLYWIAHATPRQRSQAALAVLEER